MSKPAALTDDEMKYVELCLRKRWGFFENKLNLIAGLYAMAVERNTLLAEKAAAKTVHGAFG